MKLIDIYLRLISNLNLTFTLTGDSLRMDKAKATANPRGYPWILSDDRADRVRVKIDGTYLLETLG